MLPAAALSAKPADAKGTLPAHTPGKAPAAQGFALLLDIELAAPDDDAEPAAESEAALPPMPDLVALPGNAEPPAGNILPVALPPTPIEAELSTSEGATHARVEVGLPPAAPAAIVAAAPIVADNEAPAAPVAPPPVQTDTPRQQAPASAPALSIAMAHAAASAGLTVEADPQASDTPPPAGSGPIRREAPSPARSFPVETSPVQTSPSQTSLAPTSAPSYPVFSTAGAEPLPDMPANTPGDSEPDAANPAPSPPAASSAALPPMAEGRTVPLAPTLPSTEAQVRAPGETPHDFGMLVDRLAQAREAASPNLVRATLAHDQFGPVSMQFRIEDTGLSVRMASADPQFAPAVQIAVTAATQAGPANDHGQQQPRHDGANQQATGSSGGPPGNPARDGGSASARSEDRPDILRERSRRSLEGQGESDGSPRPGRHGLYV